MSCSPTAVSSKLKFQSPHTWTRLSAQTIWLPVTQLFHLSSSPSGAPHLCAQLSNFSSCWDGREESEGWQCWCAVSASCLHASPAALLGHLTSKPQGKVISLHGLWVRPSLGSRVIAVFAFRKYLKKQRQHTGEFLQWHSIELSHKQAVLTTTET